ncbi:MAG: hypothetical protein M0Z53_14605 [Thermaerobacter sp.]|nr:hypothetical protein [Thermaerobacter sp.]
MRIRALVMAVDGPKATVMLPGGEFRTISTRHQSLVVGQECWIPATSWPPGAIPAIGAAALVLLAAAIPNWLGPAVPVQTAVISLDINPSINLMVDGTTVMGADGLDSAGRTVLSQTPLVGMTATRAVLALTRQAARDGYVSSQHPIILVGGAFDSAVPPWFAALVKAEGRLVAAHHWPVHVISVQTASPALLAAMRHPDVSVGRYLLWQNRWHQASLSSAASLRAMPLGQLMRGPVHQSGGVGSGLAKKSARVPGSPSTFPSAGKQTAPGSRPPRLPSATSRAPATMPSVSADNLSHSSYRAETPPSQASASASGRSTAASASANQGAGTAGNPGQSFGNR